MFPDSSRDGGNGSLAFYTFFTVLNRHPGTIAYCTEFLEDDYSIVVLPPKKTRFARSDLEYIKRQHKKGATIVVMVDPDQGLGEGTELVLKEFEVDLGPLPKQIRSETGDLLVGDQSVGRCKVGVYPWPETGSEVVMKLATANREYPIIVQYAPGIQLVLQAQMLRNDFFESTTGRNLSRETHKPNEDGLTVFRAVWAWLDGL